MAVNFRGRISPNIQRDPNGELTIRFNSPNNADDVTVLIREVDTYTDSEGNQVSEESNDDLLATFTGRIRNRRFEVAEHTNASDDASLPIIRIKFHGSDTVYRIPVVSEAGENEDANWEIVFVVQYAGQDDYISPVAFIARTTGRILIVDNTRGDLTDYEAHANLVRHYFVSRGFEGKIIRGARSRSSVAHYAAADTTDYPAGLDHKTFREAAPDFDYIYFNCHGDINLIGIGYRDQISPCCICDRRFSHNDFTACTSRAQCMPQHKGYHMYKRRTTDNADIQLPGPGAPNLVEDTFGEWEIERMVGHFISLDTYYDKFVEANSANPNLTSMTGPSRNIDGITLPGEEEYFINVPNRYLLPTLIAFPCCTNFRDNNLPQDPASPSATYLHAADSEDVPGEPVICFQPEGGPISSPEVSATPNAAAGPSPGGTPGSGAPATSFDSAPTGLVATPYDGCVELNWDEVSNVAGYYLYWSTTPGVDEHTAEIEETIDNSFSHFGLTNGQTYYYRVQARRGSANMFEADWRNMRNLSRVKLVFAGCCLAGRKKVLAEAILGVGPRYFIAHQVVTAGVSESLINHFWENWVNAGAILRNVINVFDQVVQTNAASYRRTCPIIYYKDRNNVVQFWRPGMAVPDETAIKLD
jgi:hypothetical protein